VSEDRSEKASEKPKAQLDAEFSDLYRAHLRDVYSYAYYRVGNHHDAEDLTEQTFLQAYRHFERAQRESHGRPLRPWLIRIAHNLAANLYRDRSRRPASPIDDTTALVAPYTTEQLVEGREQARQVLDGVSRLPEDRREALIMRFALGMDNREIARALGRSDGATKVLIHRAIKQLEGLVSDADGADAVRADAARGGAARGGSAGGDAVRADAAKGGSARSDADGVDADREDVAHE
jgi:RNA polymerase sigma-70 factor, ECF subfamily